MAKDNKFNFTDERLRKMEPAPSGKRNYYHDMLTACQSALKIDPPSASKIDPPQAVFFSY